MTEVDDSSERPLSNSSDTDQPKKDRHYSAKSYVEDTDNRRLWEPDTKYSSKHVGEQHREAWYILGVLALALLGLVAVSIGCVEHLLVLCGLDSSSASAARRYGWLCAGGLLGGTVYSAKWLYHAIAKGLWHEDRKVWRYLSPWVSLGTTVGVGALILAGFFKNVVDSSTVASGATYTGVGFLIGYFSDMFLAKMKDVTQVIFGETESHFKRNRDDRPPR